MMHDEFDPLKSAGPFIEEQILKYKDSATAFPLHVGPFGNIGIKNTKHVLKDIFDGYVFLCPASAYQPTQPLLAK